MNIDKDVENANTDKHSKNKPNQITDSNLITLQKTPEYNNVANTNKTSNVLLMSDMLSRPNVSLPTTTTTNVDTNPVLSDISIPTKLDNLHIEGVLDKQFNNQVHRKKSPPLLNGNQDIKNDTIVEDNFEDHTSASETALNQIQTDYSDKKVNNRNNNSGNDLAMNLVVNKKVDSTLPENIININTTSSVKIDNNNIHSIRFRTSDPSNQLTTTNSQLSIFQPDINKHQTTQINDSMNSIHSKHIFPIKSDSMHVNRSSTYASKSTVKAIPIRNPNSQRLLDLEDRFSTRSRSSSMTTSLSRSFLFGFYHAQKNKTDLKQKRPLISKEYWMKDESAKECFSCGKPFTTFRRKHHCRICGQIFCHACSLLMDGERLGYTGRMRVCYNCFEHINTYMDSSDEEDELDDAIVENNNHLSESGILSQKKLSYEKIKDRNSISSDSSTSLDDNHSISPNSGLPLSVSEPTEKRQKEIILLNQDDVRSIITADEDPKLFVMTPSPPPKMAIPATKQGGSLEIGFDRNRSDRKKNKYNTFNTPRYSNTNERYTIRDVDMLPKQYRSKHKKYQNAGSSEKYYSPSPSESRHKRIPNMNSLRKSLLNYVGSGNKINPFSQTFDNQQQQEIYNNTELQKDGIKTASTIIGNLTNKNFKFQFNFKKDAPKDKNLVQDNLVHLDDARNSELRYDSSSSDNSLEDEGTMSIYSSLHDLPVATNPIRSTRNSSRSLQRAQASLKRIQNRRAKNRNKIFHHHDFERLGMSAPNLLSVVADDDAGNKFLENTNSRKNSTNNTDDLIDEISKSDAIFEKSETILNARHSKTDNVNTQWKRLSSISSHHPHRINGTYSFKKNLLNEVATVHMHLLLKQVLADQDIKGKERWETVFKEVLLKKVQFITLNARDSNTLDYRQKYVKIKRIAGGTIEQSEYVNGIVFSKALPNKLMRSYIDNPRILLIMFPLEYQKNENHFLSLETVLAQEQEYLNKLVSRLTSLHPDIIFVGANVSGYALDLLLKAGVTVQYNIKPQIIERIARLTEADIAVSIDKLASNVKMGECGSFQVKTYIYGNISNTYTFLKGCNSDLGGTLLLRGDCNENLEKIKHVAEFMVYVVFALELESSFFNDNFIQLSSSFYLEKSKQKRMSIFDGYYFDFLEKFSHRILTTSPTVEFSIPFLLSKARELEAEIKHRQEQHAALEDKDISINHPEIKELGIESTLTFKDMRYITSFLQQKRIEDLQATFKKRCKQWEVFYSLSHNMLGTGSHQAITVLYSMVSTKTATPCIGPQLVNIDYFWDTDISIGQLIENIVLTAHYPCEQGCNSYLFDHYRSYVHGTGKVDIMIEKFQTKLPKLKNIILTWSYCKNCGTSTPILQISEKTWNYSFGKYLEIMFWSRKGSLSDIGNCSHDFTKDHVKYFSYGDLVIRIEYSDLDIHEVNTPPVRMRWQPNIDIKFKVENYYKILDKINMFYDSVVDRLEHVTLDSIHHSKKQNAENKINEMKQKVYQEKKTLFSDLESLYQRYPGDQHLQLNRLLKVVCDYAADWDNDFNLFEKKYLPSERDITRITSKQLKKLFGEPKSTESKLDMTNNNATTTSDTTLATNEKEKSDRNSSTGDQNTLVKGKQSENYKHALMIQQKDSIQKPHNDSPEARLLNSEEGSISTAIDLEENKTKKNSKVLELASFFDQIHLDALPKDSELHKEFTRLRGNKNKYKNYKLQSSAPIIEVYKNVKDAVAEPLHDLGSQKNHEVFNHKNIPQLTDHIITDDNKTLEKETSTNLENELENSITRWGEKVWNQENNEDNTLPEHVSLGSESSSRSTAEIKPPKKESIVAQPEKSLLMKAITNFWADRSGYLWKPLVYPISSTDHVFADNDVIIREGEPSSLAAFCLNMPDYKERMLAVYQAYSQNLPSMQNTENTSIYTLDTENHSTTSASHTTNINSTEEENSFLLQLSETPEILEQIMTKKTAVHLRYQFEDDSTVMSCKIFFSEHFDAFRKTSNCNNNFIQSLSRCIKWDSSGGKSGSTFLKTLDERFVIKELSHSELDAFIKFAPSYFEYMAQAIFHDLPTALAKVFGFYQIQVKNPNLSKNYKMDIIIMENLFYDNKPSRIFDLKGSMRNRHVEQTGKENEVLLDENMVEYIYESPIYVREYDKKLLRTSLWNDTLFLAKMNVMDYSLVVGLNSDNMVLTVGIIDFIRTFTWDKKLESWVKEKSLVGGGNKVIKQPTVVTPKQYKNRFREAMERYILMVPDPWCQEYI